MPVSLLQECNVRSVVDLSTLNIYERAIAAYLNIVYYYNDDKHWKWLQPFSRELSNLPSNFYSKSFRVPEELYVDNEAIRKMHARSHLLVAFEPESSEDLYNSVRVPSHSIGQVLHYQNIADKILSDPIWSEELHNTVLRLSRHREFNNQIELSPYLIKMRI